MFEFFKNFFRKSKTKPVVFETNQRAISFGLKYVNQFKYNGWNGYCPGTIKDSKRWEEFCNYRDLETFRFNDSDCTIAKCKKVIKKALRNMPTGGFVIIYYSGHGGQIADRDGDESDGRDETLCLYDGQLSDDVLGEMFGDVPSDVTIFFVTDCCNSETMARGKPPVVESVEKAHLGCNMIHFAGCADGKSSYGSNRGGIFTNALLASYKMGMTYKEWFDTAKSLMVGMDGGRQKPFMTTYGNTNEDDIAFGS